MYTDIDFVILNCSKAIFMPDDHYQDYCYPNRLNAINPDKTANPDKIALFGSIKWRVV
ncbi:hypothetical protein [uncultured Vibrio sp.]|uniref:hypothetical protein n=1 Tax=uncultured Vibrio sp. TaxID=114054 RepID=UPI0026256716|nr:hypothetical protein [uncultured Vibrio sp.]